MTLFRLIQEFGVYPSGTRVTPVKDRGGIWVFEAPQIVIPDADIDTYVEIDSSDTDFFKDTEAESSLKERLTQGPKALFSSSPASSKPLGQYAPEEISFLDSSDDPTESLPPESDLFSSPVVSSVRLRRKQVSAEDAELSACVDERILGYLSVRITFLDEPVVDLAVGFLDEGDAKVQGTPVTEKTDATGCYSLKELFDVGTYVCQIEHQNKAEITTVERIESPFQLVLPIGRPYFDTYNLQLEGDL
jgi:hypothetical protein